MELKDLLNKQLPQIPTEISELLRKNEITGTPFECKNDILSNEILQKEVGYKKLADGTYLVSMVCPMPNVTAEMIRWWFWWHPQADIRYQVWFPEEHISISYDRKDKAYFEQDSLPPFQPNSQYPVERIGEGVKAPLCIDFVSPQAFGFSEEEIKQNNIPLIVCGHVGVLKGIVKHTEMAHIFKQTENGLFMISRFWMGETLQSSLLRKLIITDKMATEMAKHCCIEYRNLCEILPSLYAKYK